MTNGAASFDSSDPFDLLKLPAAFDLEAGALKRAWLEASARLHPDRISDPIERADAAAALSRVNDAHATLADDERRAAALLERLGGSTDTALPDGFLIEIMEVREAMESADTTERARFEAWARDRRAEHVSRVRTLFKAAGNTPDEVRETDRRTIRIELNAWRYIERMLEQLDPNHTPIM